MIFGTVTSRLETVVKLRLRGAGNVEMDIDAIIDTGFTSSLTLPLGLVAMLGLPRQISSSAMLADGSIRQFDLYSVEVDWDGAWHPVLVSAVGSEVLLGMRLLAGHQLRIEVARAGVVEITPIP